MVDKETKEMNMEEWCQYLGIPTEEELAVENDDVEGEYEDAR